MVIEDSGVDQLAACLAGPDGTLSRSNFDAKVHRLALMWPSLAAAIGSVLVENGKPIPGPFRHARHIMKQENSE